MTTPDGAITDTGVDAAQGHVPRWQPVHRRVQGRQVQRPRYPRFPMATRTLASSRTVSRRHELGGCGAVACGSARGGDEI